MRKPEWMWAGVLAAIVLIGYGVFPTGPSSDEGTDSFSASFGGKMAFFKLARVLLEDVRRSAERLIPPEDADTLLVLGPARYPDGAEWQALHEWVAQGHALVFAARWDDPVVDMGPFGVRITMDFAPGAAAEEKPAEVETDKEVQSEDVALGLETTLASGEIEWRTNGYIASMSDEAEPQVSWHGSPQVVWQPVGEGALVVSASDFVFSNLSLTKGNNGLLAFRVLELAAPRGPVYIDEWLNASGPPKVVGLLFNPPFRPLTLQILLLAVALAWRGSVRFGPPAPTRDGSRRSLSEHARALGNLHYKVRSGARVIASYLEYFRHELRLHYRRADEAKALAERAGVGAQTVAELMRKAGAASRDPRVHPARAASLLRSLVLLKRKAERVKGASHGA